MHQYRIQYQKVTNGDMVLAEVVAHSDLNIKEFVGSLAAVGYWIEEGELWLAPGCIQHVIVFA